MVDVTKEVGPGRCCSRGHPPAEKDAGLGGVEFDVTATALDEGPEREGAITAKIVPKVTGGVRYFRHNPNDD